MQAVHGDVGKEAWKTTARGGWARPVNRPVPWGLRACAMQLAGMRAVEEWEIPRSPLRRMLATAREDSASEPSPPETNAREEEEEGRVKERWKCRLFFSFSLSPCAL